jgi:hypothetical protein
MVTDQVARNLDQIKEKTEEMKKNVNPELTSINEVPLKENIEILRHMKTMEIEAQHSIDEWKMFSKHFLHSALTIYETTFERLPQSHVD